MTARAHLTPSNRDPMAPVAPRAVACGLLSARGAAGGTRARKHPRLPTTHARGRRLGSPHHAGEPAAHPGPWRAKAARVPAAHRERYADALLQPFDRGAEEEVRR